MDEIKYIDLHALNDYFYSNLEKKYIEIFVSGSEWPHFIVVASSLNYLLISDGSAALRFAT
jgi:hypothetical protein